MPTLHVRNVPDELYERLRESAEASSRSMSAEVVTLLDELLASAPAQKDLLAGIRRRRFFRPAEAGAPTSTVLLRKDRGR
ncbi:MAG TPA: Arc family DNA-binding protein [Thermoanaerobaculia bacterium]|nr:Arc family DNA-binding protein [Thermoanaerobaculia bacterium]